MIFENSLLQGFAKGSTDRYLGGYPKIKNDYPMGSIPNDLVKQGFTSDETKSILHVLEVFIIILLLVLVVGAVYYYIR